LQLLNRWEGRAAQLRRSLGLDPSSFTQIAKDVSLMREQQDDGIERLAAEGAKIRARREAELRNRPRSEDYIVR
jgi:hypothetical protein